MARCELSGEFWMIEMIEMDEVNGMDANIVRRGSPDLPQSPTEALPIRIGSNQLRRAGELRSCVRLDREAHAEQAVPGKPGSCFVATSLADSIFDGGRVTLSRVGIDSMGRIAARWQQHGGNNKETGT